MSSDIKMKDNNHLSEIFEPAVTALTEKHKFLQHCHEITPENRDIRKARNYINDKDKTNIIKVTDLMIQPCYKKLFFSA